MKQLATERKPKVDPYRILYARLVQRSVDKRKKSSTPVYESDPWLKEARPNQLLPDGDWTTWILQAGRGFGKTRAGSETVNLWASYSQKLLGVAGPDLRIALVARSAADVRDTMVEGLSGVLRTARDWNRPYYEPSKRRITWPSGAVATTFTAAEPDLLRGPEHHCAWSDEVATWDRGSETWDNLQMGLRKGDHPRQIVTTTPRMNRFFRSIVEMDNVHFTHGSTLENRENLSEVFFSHIIKKYEGTRLGRQELEGELLDEVDGALWSHVLIDQFRIARIPDEVKEARVVVAIDPAGGGGDEIGIVAAIKGSDEHFYVIRDASMLGSPEQWGRTAINLYQQTKASRIVGEKNYGGDMIEATLRNIDRTVAYQGVTASRGKQVRAEPIAALYEQGLVHHVGSFPELEDQMCTWTPDDSESPDRMDALVWALTELADSGGSLADSVRF